jgi:uncharacterized glyoxalase superfamily protein PhnB
MHTPTPYLDAIGIVVKDMAEAIRFYSLLGLRFADGAAAEDHAEASATGGVRVMLDTEALIKQLMPEREDPRGHRMGLAFHCGSAAGVDAAHAAIVDAGYSSAKAPWDAFWGQRYAQVRDPDGNTVDLFAPL